MLNDINKHYPNIIQRIIKYLLFGLIVCISARYVPSLPLNYKEIIIIGCTASISFAIIDMISPTIKLEDNSLKN